MQPKFVSLPRMLLLGMSFYGDPFSLGDPWSEENQIGRLWSRFSAYLQDNATALQQLAVMDVCYEVHVYSRETLEKGLFEIFTGVKIDDISTAPADLLVKVLPDSEYAVFSFHGQEIISDWEIHIDEWLAQAGAERTHAYSFQRYDERFKGLGERLGESTLDVYLPVRKVD